MATLFFQTCLLIMAASESDSPITVNLLEGRGYAVFTNSSHPSNRIGYRFHEHTPIVCGEVPDTTAEAEINRDAAEPLELEFMKRTGVKTFALEIEGDGWVPQKWTYHLAPSEDGIDLLWIIETYRSGLDRYYGVQQCFRMGGVTNQAWRREIAETPAFSEFDLWDQIEKETATKTSLTYVYRNGVGEPLPAIRHTAGARTPLGVAVDTELSGGRIDSMIEVGPYHAQMLEPVDMGLITRTDKEHSWVCGIYWKHTSHVTVHHPADCLHSIVNIGGLPPHSRRILRGKIYWFRGTLADLLTHWRRDFGAE